jgi:predicted TIM-barrel enzyme
MVTGAGTGKSVAFSDLDEVARAVDAPVIVASGATIATLGSLRRAHGIIVGSALRTNGRAGGPIDPELARRFAEAYVLERRSSE